MAETFLLVGAIGYALFVLLIYIPKRINEVEAKVDSLKLHLMEIEALIKKSNKTQMSVRNGGADETKI